MGILVCVLRRPTIRTLIIPAATGLGAMTEWKDIAQIVVDKFQLSKKEGAAT